MNFNKRGLLAALAFGAAALFGTAASAQNVELKVSTYLPPNHTIHKFLEAWGADIAQRSNGRLTIKIYPASQLGPVQRQYDLARSGQADLAVGLTGATPGRYPHDRTCQPALRLAERGLDQRRHLEAADRTGAEISRARI